MKIIYIILIFQLFISCSTLFSTKTFQKNSALLINFSHDEWKNISKAGSDFAAKNINTNSIIIVNSNCKKYITTSLHDLTHNILLGLEEKKIIGQKITNDKSRDILTTKASGKLDGIQTYLKIITLKKNRCIYDYLLISKSIGFLDKDILIFDTIFTRSVIP